MLRRGVALGAVAGVVVGVAATLATVEERPAPAVNPTVQEGAARPQRAQRPERPQRPQRPARTQLQADPPAGDPGFVERVRARAASLGHTGESGTGEDGEIAGEGPVARYLSTYGVGDVSGRRSPTVVEPRPLPERVRADLATYDRWRSDRRDQAPARRDHTYERYIAAIEAELNYRTRADRSTRSAVASQRFGDLTYYSGSVGGDHLSGTTHSLGDLAFTELMVGGRSVSATTQRVGPFDFTTTSQGTSYTSHHLGGLTLTTGSDGSHATSQRVGDLTLTTGSGGLSGLSLRLGSFEYTTIERPYYPPR